MVTGAYHPETSGASLQCRQLSAALRSDAEFVVLTTTTNAGLPDRDVIDDVEVWRVFVDPGSAISKAGATPHMVAAFTELRSQFDLVHLHGFSQKTMLLIVLARTFGKRVVIKLTSLGHDDGLSIKRRGRTAFAFYSAADRFIGVSPAFEAAHREAGLDPARFRLIPNGVDTTRFRPADRDERRATREALGLPADAPVVLFVGFFSHEKRPDLLYRAWRAATERGTSSTLVLIGATRSTYYEIDPEMADTIRSDAAARGLRDRVVFIEQTSDIERYYRAADVFALPTLREGLPNVLLEAMAAGVPAIITRLEGVTDWIVQDGATGILVPPSDEDALTDALSRLLRAPDLRACLGKNARAHVAEHFPASLTAEQTLGVYRELTAGLNSRPT
jgi:glycosyltransferase involved in cell wall biosynthesis